MAETRSPQAPASVDDVERLLRRQTRRSLLVGGAAALAGLAGWRWLRTRDKEGGLAWPFRRVLELNERLAQAYYQESRRAPEFPLEQAAEPRVNYRVGVPELAAVATWKLRVEGAGAPVELTVDDIKALPRVDMVTELKCVEGWSQVVHWTGARLVDLIAGCPLATPSGQVPDLQRHRADLYPYVGLETPGGGYTVGLEMATALHPQTLLCYAMGGRPLTWGHGAPLRLVTPLKYGFKSIKWLSTLRFTDQRPVDYWAEQGYDWYAGH
jgi:DMSO/TMAO reductase YedYZ molybdopterin-dependent catalytic subunit